MSKFEKNRTSSFFIIDVNAIFTLQLSPMLVKVTNMGAELQSQNRVDVDYEKTTGPIFLKFWHKFLLQSTIEIQK